MAVRIAGESLDARRARRERRLPDPPARRQSPFPAESRRLGAALPFHQVVELDAEEGPRARAIGEGGLDDLIGGGVEREEERNRSEPDDFSAGVEVSPDERRAGPVGLEERRGNRV